jgi:hypothetical protein
VLNLSIDEKNRSTVTKAIIGETIMKGKTCINMEFEMPTQTTTNGIRQRVG